MPTDRTDKKWEVIVAGVVAIIFLIVALVLGLEITGNGSDTTPVLSMILAMVAPTIVGLIALLKTVDIQEKTKAAANTAAQNHDKLEAIMNGVGQSKIKEAVSSALDERENSNG